MWFVVVCGSLWWFVVVCGGLWCLVPPISLSWLFSVSSMTLQYLKALAVNVNTLGLDFC